MTASDAQRGNGAVTGAQRLAAGRTRRDPECGRKPLLSIEETAILLGESRATCYRAVRAGTFPLPVIQLGQRLRVPRRAVERLIDGLDPFNAPDPDSSGSQSGLDASSPAPATGRRTRAMCSAARRSSSGTPSV